MQSEKQIIERKLLLLSIDEAKKQYPDGFNKEQLVAISKKIRNEQKICDPVLFGKIKTDDDICKQRSNMIVGNYPANISDCEVVGINGNCGLDCPVFLRGDCKNEEMNNLEDY